MEQEKIEIILNNIEKDFKIKKEVLIRPKTIEDAIALYNQIKGVTAPENLYKFVDYLNDDCITESEEIYTINDCKTAWLLYGKDYINFCQKHKYAFENYGV
ncbi:hypothetical protein FDJ70_07770 [Clostridium botulinum]|uniref:hypothetical protein n=1 Tax=Clostridium botulinum TaxID=1491 RepID=UPI0013F72254|nr:hypothetical protein [Clostridium botulinum]MCD3217440.1 hypothetical protein [Clostridium botulinum C]NFV47570.1 hypothetical protein [Clostridium botulinum]